jgi:hypothetical protein
LYGLINKAVQEYVTNHVGPDGWDRVCRRCDLQDPFFVPFQQYPDELTYSLVGAASEEMGQSAESLLHGIGEYWSRFTAQEGYGHLLEFAGDDFASVISRLNDLHARLSVTMPELRPPSFDFARKEDGTLVVRYYSERLGLSPLVVGLLRGLAGRFGQTADVLQTVHRGADSDYDEFEVNLRERTEA